ncbi:MAG TPA: WYL domain-containing transcriptional regulator [Thermodesulfovibrio thiophilus]|nr:WYL domain-containing transcriptional regulator [Thermodesulfovibrio thiophilus]
MKKSFPENRRNDKPAGISEKVINIIKIIRLIEEGKYPSVRNLAEDCEVTERTVYRYINIINAILPVLFDRKKKGYRFEHPEALKLFPLDKEEIALLATISDMAAQTGFPLKDACERIMKKILPNKSQEPTYRMLISPVQVSIDENAFKVISEAITSTRRIEIEYQSINTKKKTTRKVDPYGLFYYDGIWFVYGYCHLRKAHRLFALDRISSIKVKEEIFNKPEVDELNKSLESNFVFWQKDGKLHDVVVRFTPPVADVINRKNMWHPSEKRRILQSGEVELSFRVSHVDELKWWIYSWIPHVRVIKPSWLKEEMKKELDKAIKLL